MRMSHMQEQYLLLEQQALGVRALVLRTGLTPGEESFTKVDAAT